MKKWLQERLQNFRFANTVVARLQEDEGVTLIELMAVVVILGVIAAIAIPVVTGAIAQAKVNTTETNLGTLQQAIERYAADHGQYPSSLLVLDEQTNSAGSVTPGGKYGPYLSTSFPESDSWGNPIYYAPVVKGSVDTGYVLFSSHGSAVTFGGSKSQTSPTSGTGFIYASGGQGPAGHTIASAPTVDSSKTLPTTLSSTSGTTLDPNTLTYSDQ